MQLSLSVCLSFLPSFSRARLTWIHTSVSIVISASDVRTTKKKKRTTLHTTSSPPSLVHRIISERISENEGWRARRVPSPQKSYAQGVDVTVMTRTRIYEKYHNAEWRNKKLALYQIPLSSSAAADRRSCTARARGPPADARSSIVTRCKRRQKCARLNFSRMNHRFRGTHAHTSARRLLLHRFASPFSPTPRGESSSLPPPLSSSRKCFPIRELIPAGGDDAKRARVNHVLSNLHRRA